MTDWLTAIGVLLTGLIAGFMIVYGLARRKAPAAPSAPIDRRDLEAKRDALLQQLREIEDGDPAAAGERARLEREAAHVLRALDSVPSTEPAASSASASSARVGGSGAVAGFLWGAGSVTVLVLIGYFAMKSAAPKTAPAPSAGSPGPAAAPMQATDTALQPLEAAVRKNPDDLDARIELARAYLDRENLMGVFEQTQYVLGKAPRDPRAQTYQAIVRIAIGQPDEARRLLEEATKHDPSLTDAWIAFAWLHMREGKQADAEAAIAEAKKRRPEDSARLDEILAQMRAQAAAAGAAPKQGAAMAPRQTAPAGKAVHITLEVLEGVRLPARGVVYVVARPAGTTSGPPLAVRRVDLAALPAKIDLSEADSMMGQPLPDTMRVEARVDTDGSAMTREPGAPTAAADGVRAGSRVTLRLAPPAT